MSVDILLSVYKGGKYLIPQLESLAQQSFHNWRLIARIDGDDSESLEVLKNFRSMYTEKVLIIEKGGNVGACKSFLTLLEYSNAPFVMFCDQDDIWLPDKIEITRSKAIEISQVGKPCMVFTDLIVVDGELNEVAESFIRYQRIIIPPTPNSLLVSNSVTGCTLLINCTLRDLILKYQVKNAVMHDWWASLVCLYNSGVVAYLDRPTVLYRQHSSNLVGAQRFGSSLELICSRRGIRSLLNRSQLVYKQAKVFKTELSISGFIILKLLFYVKRVFFEIRL